MSYNFTYMWNLEKRINEQTKQNKLIDTESILMVAGLEKEWKCLRNKKFEGNQKSFNSELSF